MNEHQIIEALRESESSARALDPQQVIDGARLRRRRRWLASAAAATAVAGTVAAVGLVGGRVVDPEPASSGESSVHVTTRLEGAELAKVREICTRRFPGPATDGALVHPVEVLEKDGGGTAWVILREKGGGGSVCVVGPTPELTMKFELPTAGTYEPTGGDSVVDLGMGGPAFEQGTGGELRGFQWGALYRVDLHVAQLRQRYVVAGQPGPWFVADAVDGYVYMHSWLDRSLPKGESATMQTEALGPDGELVPDFDLRERQLRMGADGTPEMPGFPGVNED